MLTLHNSVAPVPRSVHRNATTSESHNRLFRLNLWQRLVRHGDIRLVGLMVLSRFSPRLSVVVVTRLRWLFARPSQRSYAHGTPRICRAAQWVRWPSFAAKRLASGGTVHVVKNDMEVAIDSVD